MRPMQPVQRMHAFPADVQKMCRRRKTEKSHEESCDSSWDFGALVGTRIPGPLIKSATRAPIVYIQIIGLSRIYIVSALNSRSFALYLAADFAPVATSVQLCNRADSVQKPCRGLLETLRQFIYK